MLTKDNIQAGTIGVLMPEGELLDLGVLTDEQKDLIKAHIISIIDQNMEQSRGYLSGLWGVEIPVANEIPAEESEAVQEATEEPVEVVPVEEVARAEEEPVVEEAPSRKRGRKKKEVPVVEPEPEVEKEPVPEYPPLDPEKVRRLYIEEGKTLTSVAAYFGISKKELKEYIDKMRIFRAPKTPDGFRG